MRRVSGFTLLEVLVAMTIFSVIGLGAQQMLRTIIDTHEKTRDQIQGFSDLSRAFVVMERDFSQTVPRNIRDEYGEMLPAFMLDSGPYFIELTRTGWSNPIGSARSNLQRVAYELNEEGEIERHFWLVLDRAEDSKPITQTILAGVDDFSIRLLIENGESTDVWPDTNSSLQIPLAAELILQTQSFGELRKVFSFVRPLSQGSSSGADANEGDDTNDSDNDDASPDDNGNNQAAGSDTGSGFSSQRRPTPNNEN